MKDMPDTVGYYPAYFQNTGVLGLLFEWISNGKDASEDLIVDIIYEYAKTM